MAAVAVRFRQAVASGTFFDLMNRIGGSGFMLRSARNRVCARIMINRLQGDADWLKVAICVADRIE